MSVNSVQQFLNVRDSHLRVVSGNVHADQMVLGGITVDTSHGLQSVTNTSNVTTNTVEFSNTTTAFVTTANVEVGGELTVSGNATVTANAEIGGDLTVSGNTFYSNNTSIHVDSNVVAEFTGPHGREPKEMPLKKYPEIAFDASKMDGNDSTNTYVQAGYTVTASGTSSSAPWAYVWGIFDETEGDEASRSSWIDSNNTTYAKESADAYGGLVGNVLSTVHNTNTLKLASNTPVGAWFTIELPNSIKLDHIQMRPSRWGTDLSSINSFPREFGIWGYEGNAWTLIKTVTEHTATNNTSYLTTIINSNTPYEKIGFVITRINAQGSSNSNDRQFTTIGALKLYGYEEDQPLGDTSVDTTFTSIMNTPQTTGANVYVDAKLSSDFTNQVTGPTPVGTAAVHDNTNKYWTLNGTLTSNVTLEANTFLEGDQPHAVSVWFNSSNLEANTANTCVFSVSDQEKLDSINLDLQSNTWHNLTYAYQGEGGSRVTYLDGRKVAEDQAEDTFGEYPPFAMTGYSQGGYVVSASGEYNTTEYNAWKAFDGDTTSENNSFITPNDSYVSASGATKGNYLFSNAITDNTSTVHRGEWIKMEFPHKLVVSSVKMDKRPYASADLERMLPAEFAILGSNNDQTWYLIHNRTGIATNAPTGTHFVSTGNYKTKGFKYVVIVLKKASSNAASNEDHIAIGEITFYGHRENDLVHLPDPTNVLKYPHVVMTGPAQRGYVASASAAESDSQSWEAFDGSVATNTSGWIWNTSGTHNLGTESGSGTATDGGHWIRLELPHKLVVNRVDVISDAQNPQGRDEFPDEYAIYGWNGIGTWTKLLDVTGKNPTAGTSTTFSDTISNSTAYKHIALVVKSYYNNSSNYGRIVEIKYYGTEEATSVPIQIGGGNIDKVANFRVYDKFVGEDQALEIWDAQKEEFGRVKSSMTLYKGRLGIGTTEPEGRLAVLDEPHNLEEFPPRAMTANRTHIEGHGVFKASSSSEYSATYTAFDAFDKITNNDVGVADNAWLSVNSSLYASASDYAFTGSTTLGNGTVAGEWLKLELPYKIVLKSITLSPRPNTGNHLNQAPEDFKIYGSNDDINWTEVLSETGAAPALWTGTNFITDTSSTTSYRYFAIVVQKTIGYAGFTAISGLKYFGTREQGQSVLHDGQLTLTKSLTVPRIGPALDADDTPRRDRLVVEYNTSTNPTFEGAVRDTSGRGNDGILMDGAYYDAIEKALDIDSFDSTLPSGSQTAHIRSGIIPGFTGNQHHTISLWFKTGGDYSGTWAAVAPQSGESTKQVSSIAYEPAGRFKLESWGNDIATGSYPLQNGRWYHVVVTYDGATVTTSTKKFYVNGTAVATSDVSSGSAINFTDPVVILGQREQGGSEVNGQVSNFKLYDTALTVQEVEKLYDMGRNGSVANPQPLHIAAPLYAPGTIVQAQYASTPLNNTVRQLITGGELSDAANDVDYLDMNFKPKFANSSILLTAMINNTCTHVASFGFKEDGTIVRTQADNTNSTGGISTIYDGTAGNPNSTVDRMYNINIQVMVPANGTHTRRYNVAANSYWDNNNYNLYINDRNDNSMRSISNMVVYEIVN